MTRQDEMNEILEEFAKAWRKDCALSFLSLAKTISYSAPGDKDTELLMLLRKRNSQK